VSDIKISVMHKAVYYLLILLIYI